MDTVREVWVLTQTGIVGLSAALDLAEHAGDAEFLGGH